jgi:hypothetical protein
LVAFSLYVKDEGSSLALYIAGQVVVVSQFKLGLEHNFNRLV